MKRFSLAQYITYGAEIIFSVVILLIGLLTFFLYREYYQSIGLTKDIAALSVEVTTVEIDSRRADRVRAWFDRQKKLPPIDPAKINNPFK